jgi:hypothetical protein
MPANVAAEVIKWLLEDEIPSVRYRALTGLLDHPADDPAVQAAKAAIPTSPDVVRIFKRMHPDGYWLQKSASYGGYVGDGTLYGSFASTHFVLAYLAELGMDRSHPDIARASDRYLDLQQPDGDFLGHYSCLFGYNIRTFILLGYRDDPRLQKTIDLMLRTVRVDGGYLCDMHEGKYKTRETRSCIRGCVKALMAFAEMPEYWDHPRSLALVDYFRVREGIFKSRDLTKPINKDVNTTRFPIAWRASITDILYALSRMGYGREVWLARAWDALEQKKDPHGRYILDWAPAQAPLKPGPRSEANKWVTLYALLARKYAGLIL